MISTRWFINIIGHFDDIQDSRFSVSSLRATTTFELKHQKEMPKYQSNETFDFLLLPKSNVCMWAL